MEYAFRKSSPQSRALRLGMVAALHIALVYGLVSVMGTVEIVKLVKDVTVTILPRDDKPVKEVERQIDVKPTPVTQTTVPPPIIDIEQQAQSETVTVKTSSTPNNPSGVPGIASETSNNTSATPSLATACPNSQAVRNSVRYPLAARRDGLEGDVVARFTVGANGTIRDVAIVSSTNRAFNSTVAQAVAQFSCAAQGRDVAVEVPFSFRLN
jgi:protein TonB